MKKELQEKFNQEICEFYKGYVESDEMKKLKRITYDQMIEDSYLLHDDILNRSDRWDPYADWLTRLSAEALAFHKKWKHIIRMKDPKDGKTYIFYQDLPTESMVTIFTYKDFALFQGGQKKKYFLYYDANNKMALAFSAHFFERFNIKFFYKEYEQKDYIEIIRNFLKVNKKQNYLYFENAVSGEYKSENDVNIIDCDGIYLGKIYHNLSPKIQHMAIFETCLANFSLYDWQNKLKNALPLSEKKVLFSYNLRDL